MEVQDYEYYEAHAKDIKLGDITSSQNNAQILAKIRDNDNDFTNFVINTEIVVEDWDFVVGEGDHLGWLGYFVGRNDKLTELLIFNFPEDINLNIFLEGLAHNRSIERLDISKDIGKSFQSLIPFLKNNDSLCHLTFNGFDIGLQCARNIVLLLSQQSSLKQLDFEEANLDGEGLAQIATALRSQPQIEELCFSSTNSTVRNGYVALGNALEGCLNLRKLDLSVFDFINETNNDIRVGELPALVAGLKHCHNLISLRLFGIQMITEEGSRSLSALFQSDNCQLEELDINRMNIDDDGMALLATGLVSLPSLKRLILRDNFIGDRGLQHLVRGLVNYNLEELCLDSITDEGLLSFFEGMGNRCNLRRLDLSYNRLITANGLASLSPIFRADHCSLWTLSLHGINIGDEWVAALANALIGNKSLTTLGISELSVTARGWAAFSRLLCDSSSVNNTFLSNHTLKHVGSYGMENFPSDIEKYLNLNKLQNQDAAICKILHCHPDIDVMPLFRSNLKYLPLLIAWFENAKPHRFKVNVSTQVFKNRQLTAIYKFIRGMPLLAAKGFRSQKVKDAQLQLELDLKSKKRKHDQTV